MKRLHLLIPILTFTAALLPSCAPLTREVPFNEAAFAPYKRSGTASVSGAAFTILRNKDKIWAYDNATVKLLPDNAYTEEVVQKRFDRNRKLVPPDPRYAQYVRKVHPDHDGNFVFQRLPAGRFLVACHLTWSTTNTGSNDDGSSYEYESSTDQWIYARVTLKDGQRVNVTDWYQGR